jgi:hypothetical protein
MKTILATLTDGSVRQLEMNDCYQIKVGSLSDDVFEACALLDCAPCEIRYGFVHPGQKVEMFHEDGSVVCSPNWIATRLSDLIIRD